MFFKRCYKIAIFIFRNVVQQLFNFADVDLLTVLVEVNPLGIGLILFLLFKVLVVEILVIIIRII